MAIGLDISAADGPNRRPLERSARNGQCMTLDLATWLLKHCVSNEALAGDLTEEYEHGRSRLWYWRQVLSASILEVGWSIRGNRLLAVRAALTGIVTLHAIRFFSNPLNTRVMDWVQGVLHRALTKPDGTWTFDAAGTFMVCFAVYIRGLPVMCATYLVCGALLARMGPSNGKGATVVPFAVLDLVVRCVWITATWHQWRLQWEPYLGLTLLWILAILLLPIISIVVGTTLIRGTRTDSGQIE
jgi:hypothetical protein